MIYNFLIAMAITFGGFTLSSISFMFKEIVQETKLEEEFASISKSKI